MARNMPVQNLRQAHLDHLTNKEPHIVDPLCDDDQFTLPKEIPWPVDSAAFSWCAILSQDVAHTARG